MFFRQCLADGSKEKILELPNRSQQSQEMLYHWATEDLTNWKKVYSPRLRLLPFLIMLQSEGSDEKEKVRIRGCFL